MSKSAHVLYISGEEDILEKARSLSPRALIVDSIHTVTLKGVTGSPGGISQVKKCALELLRFAKKTNIPVFFINHVTKSGNVAGPRVLEHIVDAVIYLEIKFLIQFARLRRFMKKGLEMLLSRL